MIHEDLRLMHDAETIETEARKTMACIKGLNKQTMPYKLKAELIAKEKDEWWGRVKYLMVRDD